MPDMYIRKFALNRVEYGDRKGQYDAEFHIEGGAGSYLPDMKVHLEKEQIDEILAVLLPAAVDAFSESAKRFRTSVMNSLNPAVEAEALPAPETGD